MFTVEKWERADEHWFNLYYDGQYYFVSTETAEDLDAARLRARSLIKQGYPQVHIIYPT